MPLNASYDNRHADDEVAIFCAGKTYDRCSAQTYHSLFSPDDGWRDGPERHEEMEGNFLIQNPDPFRGMVLEGVPPA